MKFFKMSLDDQEISEKVDIVLLDASLSIDKYLFKDHPVLFNLGNSDGYKHQLDMHISEFMPILNNLISTNIKNEQNFLKTCDYFGEIELPIYLKKDSSLIQKWSLSIHSLLQCEIESFMLSIYCKMDKEEKFEKAREETFQIYVKDEMNHKLNQKSGNRLLKTLQTFDKESLLFCLDDELIQKHMLNEPKYPTIKCENKWWRPYSPNTYSISKGLDKLSKKFKNFPFNSYIGYGFCVIAGGDILRQIVNEEVHAYYHSDIDIFLITRDENEAKHMIREIYDWVRYLSDGNLYMTRTKNAITISTLKGTFQIITRLYHDVLQLLYGFDLAPSCLAYTGKEILTTGRGLDCIKTNEFQLLCWKQSKTMAWRCRKMRMRRFAITIPGLTMQEFEKELETGTKNNKTILKKIIHGEGKRGSDYDEFKHEIRSLERSIRHLQDGIAYGFAKQIDVLTKDIDVILDTREMDMDDGFTIINNHGKVNFIKEMAHGQNTGSFQPTSENFFDGIKW